MPKFEGVVFERFGVLNAAGDNCILLPTYYAGTDKSYAPMIGPNRPLDPSRWFIVVTNMLGNGVSNSPSNDAAYVNTTIEDNVRLQHALLTSLGVKSLALIYGWSMGAMQGFHWAALYPDMVKSLLAVCGTARCWPLNSVFLEGLKAALPSGKRAFGRVYAGWAYSAAFYRDELYRELGFGSLEAFLRFWEDDYDSYDARDLLAMLWTWQNAALHVEQLAAIRARTIVMPCDTDMYFTVDEARQETASIPSAQLRPIISPYGHCAGAPGRFAAETALIELATLELLRDQK